MLREGSKVNVVFDRGSYWEWKPGTFTVQPDRFGRLGIDYNKNHSAYTECGYEVVPFCHFASTVNFISTRTNTVYHWDNIKNRLVEAGKIEL